jgi:hypothetical protein
MALRRKTCKLVSIDFCGGIVHAKHLSFCVFFALWTQLENFTTKKGKSLTFLAHTNMRTSFPPSIVDEGTRYDCFWRWAFLSSYLSFLCKVFSLVKFWICFCCKLNDYLKKKIWPKFSKIQKLKN